MFESKTAKAPADEYAGARAVTITISVANKIQSGENLVNQAQPYVGHIYYIILSADLTEYQSGRNHLSMVTELL